MGQSISSGRGTRAYVRRFGAMFEYARRTGLSVGIGRKLMAQSQLDDSPISTSANNDRHAPRPRVDRGGRPSDWKGARNSLNRASAGSTQSSGDRPRRLRTARTDKVRRDGLNLDCGHASLRRWRSGSRAGCARGRGRHAAQQTRGAAEGASRIPCAHPPSLVRCCSGAPDLDLPRLLTIVLAIHQLRPGPPRASARGGAPGAAVLRAAGQRAGPHSPIPRSSSGRRNGRARTWTANSCSRSPDQREYHAPS